MSKVQSQKKADRETGRPGRFGSRLFVWTLDIGHWTLDIGLILLLSAAGGFAQNRGCTLKVADLPDAPETFGFRLGMTTQEVKARLPRIKLGKANDFGVSQTTINPDFDPLMDKTMLPGVRSLSFDFMDGRVSSLWFGFDGSFKWHNVPDFVSGISRSLRLPDGWTPWKTTGQQLKCADFQMTVGYVAEGPSFHITDLAAERAIAERRRDQAEAAEDAPETVEIVADAKEKVYYEAGCTPGELKPEDRIVFDSKEAAEKAGYKIAKKCE